MKDKLNAFFILATCLLPLNGWAQESSPDTTSEYQTHSTLSCGVVNVHVVTYCEPGIKQSPDCFLQKVIFTNSVTKKTSRQFYLYGNYKEDMSLIVGLICVKKSEGEGVVLESTNLGNCEVCEWRDYFDNAGVLLGSSRYKFGATNFRAKPISDTFYQKHGYMLDSQGRLVELNRVDVSRVNR